MRPDATPPGPAGRRARLSQVLLALAGAALAGNLALVANGLHTLRDSERHVEHTQEVLTGLADLQRLVQLTWTRHLSRRLHPDQPAPADPAARLWLKVDAIRSLTSDNAGQQALLVTLGEQLRQLAQAVEDTDPAAGRGPAAETAAALHLARAEAILDSMRAEEVWLMDRRRERSETVYREALTGTAAATLLGLLLVYTSARLARRALIVRHRLAAIVDSSSDAILTYDLAGRIQSWNPAAEAMFGWTEAQMIGRSPASLIPEGQPSRLPSILEAIARDEPMPSWHTTLLHRDGRAIDASIAVAPLRDATGRPVGVSSIVRDIGDLRRAQHELQLADRRKDEFLATLGHELRNPLAALTSSVQLLRRLPRGDARHELAQGVMDRQLTHMTRLVNDLLDASRVRQGKVSLERQRMDLRSAIDDAVELVAPAAQARGQDIVVQRWPEPLPIEGDRTRLAQAVGNLLHNAVKYNAPHARVSLVVERVGHHARIHVRDEGVGIAPELLPRVFDLFVQADSVAHQGQGGLGVGLTLVRTLVDMHGGTVSAASEGVGRGSTFTIELPLLPESPGSASLDTCTISSKQ